MVEESKKIILDEEIDYTLTSLTKKLNEVFIVKKTNKPFNRQDVQQYIYEHKLPAYLGGNEIIEIKSNLPIKLYRVKGQITNKL